MSKHFSRLFPLLLLIFVDSFSYFIVIPIFLQLYFNNSYGLLSPQASLTTRNFLTGFTICLSTFVALIAAPFAGNASDHYGRKKTLLFCIVLISIGFFLPIIGILKKNIIFILLGRLLAGIGSASQPIAQAAVADLCKSDEKALFLSWIAIAMTIPLIIGPLAGGYLSDANLVSWFNVTVPYWFALLLTLIIFFLILFFFEETLNPSKIRTSLVSVSEVILNLGRVVKTYKIGMFLFIFFFLEVGWSQYYQSIPLYLLEEFHYSPQLISLFSAYMGILMFLGLFFLYPLLLRYLSINQCMRFSVIIVLISLAGCTFLLNDIAQWIFSPLIAIFTATAYVSLLTLISNRVESIHQGWIMGLASTILFSAWLLTGSNVGWLMSLYHTLHFWVSFIALVITCTVAIIEKYKS